MGKKRKTKKLDTQRIVLAIENPSIDIEKYGFTFALQIPPLTEEAKLPLHTYRVMKHILTEEDLEDYKLPTLVAEDSDEGDESEPQIKTEYTLPDLANPRHQEIVFSMLPAHYQSLLNNIAYLDLAVIKITKDGQEIAVQDEDNNIHEIDSFLDFITYVGSVNPQIQLLPLVDSLVNDFIAWRQGIEVNPVELKN